MDVHDAGVASDHIASARKLAPLLTAAAPRIDAACELPSDVLQAMHAEGMFRLLVPRSLGGAELDPATYIQCVEAIAAGDASVAWCMNQGSGCSLSGGRWYSYYDGVSQTSSSALDIDHLVPLAEAWDSGARTWSASRREAYANDLGDSHTLVGVTASLNRSKGDQDVAEWLPPINRCRYIKDWVTAKIRWGLSQDSAEKSALQSVAGGCTNSTITVTIAG